MKTFPESFIFGIGDADLQVIGERNCLDHEQSLPTMWTECAKESGRVHQNQTPLEGVDRYNRWAADIELLVDLGVKDYRTSVSMARILREDGSVNSTAISWYRRYFMALKERGIKVHVTLYHWELPLFLHRRGGWTHRDSIAFMERHTQVVVQQLGELIDQYFLINEHICIAFLGYFEGLHAPFEKDLSKALMAAHNLLVAQGRSFRVIKECNPNATVGTVYNLCPVYGETASEKDLTAQKQFNGLFFDWLLEPIYTGRYPEHMVHTLKDHLPQFNDSDMKSMQIGAELDLLGINYYFGQTVRYDAQSPTSSQSAQTPYRISTGLGWPVYAPPVYPSGLYDLLIRTYARYELHGLKRILITENGTAWPVTRDEQGRVDDRFRIEYCKEHLSQIWQAIRAGVPVEGYFMWTLLDNYEWQEGYRPESAFGIVHVDRGSMKREKKLSFDWYKQVIKNRAV